MGMTEWTLHWWTISYANLRSICGPEVEAVESHPDFEGDEEPSGWYRIASDDLHPECSPSFPEVILRLQDRFREVTGGLDLTFLQYDREMDGTRGRDVEPHEDVVFGVTGVVALTPAGVANQHLIQESSWTDAG
jgi:hypothetical protein